MKNIIVTNTEPGKINHIVDAFQGIYKDELLVLNQLLRKKKMSLLEKIMYKLKMPLDSDGINQRLLEAVKKFNPNFIIIIKGNVIKPSTFKIIKTNNPSVKIISWSLDDMYAWHNRSLYYTRGIKYYDHVFTTKSYNVDELYSLGAKKITYLNQAYSKTIHIPSNTIDSRNYKYDVLFIGTAEKERVSSLNYLAENGIRIDIFGGDWDKKEFSQCHPNLHINKHDLIGLDYADAISSAKISLCFLRKINRDLHTSRSIEIPACRGFMLAEKTVEHSNLFRDDLEAVYFENDMELLEKVKYYLSHNKEREKITSRGYRRCIESDYSYDSMAEKIIYESNL